VSILKQEEKERQKWFVSEISDLTNIRNSHTLITHPAEKNTGFKNKLCSKKWEDITNLILSGIAENLVSSKIPGERKIKIYSRQSRHPFKQIRGRYGHVFDWNTSLHNHAHGSLVL